MFLIFLVPGSPVLLIGVKTADIEYADTDADIQLEISDNSGTTSCTTEVLDNPGTHDFQRGYTTVFTDEEVLGDCPRVISTYRCILGEPSNIFFLTIFGFCPKRLDVYFVF